MKTPPLESLAVLIMLAIAGLLAWIEPTVRVFVISTTLVAVWTAFIAWVAFCKGEQSGYRKSRDLTPGPSLPSIDPVNKPTDFDDFDFGGPPESEEFRPVSADI